MRPRRRKVAIDASRQAERDRPLKIRALWVGCLALSLCAVGAAGQSFTLPEGDTRSGFRDLSNVMFGNSAYKLRVETQAGDPDLYINGVTLTPSNDWDSLLDSTLPAVQYGTGYNLGDPISGGSVLEWFPVVIGSAIDPGVPDGVYHTTMSILGGADANAQDLLASFGIAVEVAEKLDISVTAAASPSTIPQGGTTQVSMTVKNNMIGHDFVSTTWWLQGFVSGSDQLGWSSFNGYWFNQTIAPGDSRTDLHSTWFASANQAPGTYLGTLGVVGGLYNGDWYYVSNDPQARITVRGAPVTGVPEPSAWATVGLGLAVLAPILRRRK